MQILTGFLNSRMFKVKQLESTITSVGKNDIQTSLEYLGNGMNLVTIFESTFFSIKRFR